MWVSISLKQPGIWTYDVDTSKHGPGLGQKTPATGRLMTSDQRYWDYTPAEANATWTWSAVTQQWSAGNTASWNWNTSAQRWVRSTDPSAAGEKPEDPPEGPPSPLPDEVTPAGKTYTVVAQATVNNPAIPGSD
jgi:hypothetical protein